MVLYKLNNPKKDNTNIYARDQQHIVGLVAHYVAQLTPEDKANPQLQGWLKQNSVDDIIEVESGHVLFQAGFIDMSRKGDLFEELQVTDDFTVHVNEESLPYFEESRAGLSNPPNKRGQLYRFHTPGMFGSQNFLPEDVVSAIVGFDLTPLYEKARENLAKLESLREHPNVDVRFRKGKTF